MLSFFRRKAVRDCLTTDFQDMRARMARSDAVRLNFDIPKTTAELMVLHGQLGREFAKPTNSIEEAIRRSNSLTNLKRYTADFLERNEINPIIAKKIYSNVQIWQSSLSMKLAPTPKLPWWKYYTRHFSFSI